MALTAIVLLAVTSAIVLAARALPDPQRAQAFDLTIDGGTGLSQLTGDARHALHFAELSARAVTFSVPDRDGDGQPDRIRYHWSGTPGQPLYRSVNGGPGVAVLDAVHALSFSTETQNESFSYTGADIKSGEVVVGSFYTASNQNNVRVEYSKWYAQCLQPTLPSNALRWQVTRAMVGLRHRTPADGTLRVALHAANGDKKPTGSALAAANLSESSFGNSFAWQEAAFSGAPVVSAGDDLTIVLSQTGGNNEAGEVLYATSGSSILGYHESTNSGSSWSYTSNRTLLYYAFGHHWTPGVTRTLNRTRHTRFAAEVTLTGNTGSPLRTGCNLLNRPYAASQFWRLTFDEPNPTLTDANGDGVGDWTVRGGGSFTTADVSGGAWTANQRLDSKPNDNFTAPTTVELRIKSTTTGQEGAGFWINADWGANATNAGIYGRLVGGATQTLNLYMETPGPDLLLKQVAGLPQGWVDVLLVVDPINDEVALFTNGVYQGAFSFVFESDINDTPNVTLEKLQGGAAFDHVTVVVGGSY